MKKNWIQIVLLALPFLTTAQTLHIGSGSTFYSNGSTATPVVTVNGGISNSGTLTLEGGLSGSDALTISGTLDVAISNATVGTGYDQILVTNAVTLSNATLHVTLAGGYTPIAGATFTIIDGGSQSGSFTTTNLPALSGGLTWTTDYDPTAGTVILMVTSTLPVELLRFVAKNDPSAPQNVVLNWETAAEINTEFYTIERSRDGRTFKEIGKEWAKGANSNYASVDKNAFSGLNYYRLKIHDRDGKISYSKIVSVLVGNKTFKIRAYPTLVTQKLTVTTDGGEINSYEIFNINGQVARFQKGEALSQNGTLQLNLEDLPSATYFLKVTNSEGLTNTIKFVKQ